MSACDTCPEPGHCCKRLHLSGSYDEHLFGPHQTELDALVWMATSFLPFLPIPGALGHYDSGTGERSFVYTCPLLGHDGRCTDYDHRPDLCREFAPLSDPLCILHTSHQEQAMNELKVGSKIKDNDPRNGTRVLTIESVGIGTLADHVTARTPAPTNRLVTIQCKRIYTDGKARKSGFTLLAE